MPQILTHVYGLAQARGRNSYCINAYRDFRFQHHNCLCHAHGDGTVSNVKHLRFDTIS